MDRTFWHKQTPDKPLFPDLLWSRPENKRLAGKLLIVGGNAHGFAVPAAAYGEAEKAGIGTARVLLPNSLEKTVGRVFPAGEYAPSTPSGSFGQTALAELLDMAAWADGVLLAGDLGRNSETAILLEQMLIKYRGQLSLTGDALDYFLTNPAELLGRPNTLLGPTFSQLQKLASASHFATAFTSKLDFLHIIDGLHEFTEQHDAYLIFPHQTTIFVAIDGQVTTTKPVSAGSAVLQLATQASVWWLQNPSQPLAAVSSAVIAR